LFSQQPKAPKIVANIEIFISMHIEWIMSNIE